MYKRQALAAGLVVSDLENGDDENSNMPSFTYQCDGIAVGVTKSGGFVTYMVNSREIGEERLSYSTLLKNASAYLEMCIRDRPMPLSKALRFYMSGADVPNTAASY